MHKMDDQHFDVSQDVIEQIISKDTEMGPLSPAILHRIMSRSLTAICLAIAGIATKNTMTGMFGSK